MIDRLREVVSTYETGISVAYLVSKHRMSKADVEAAAEALEAEGFLERHKNDLVPVRPAKKWITRAWR